MRVPLSESRLQTAQCLYLFRELYVRKSVKMPKSGPMMTGGFFHMLADRYMKALARDGKVGSDPAVMDRLFGEAWAARGLGDLNEFGGLSDAYRDDLYELAMRWAGRTGMLADLFGTEVRIAVDSNWEPVEWFSDQVYFRAVIDRIAVSDDKAVVRDYKTSYQAVSQDEAERSHQLRTYAALIHALVPIKNLVVELDFVRPNIVRAVQLGERDIEKARQRIDHESRRINNALQGDVQPTPGALCAECPLFDTCPARTAARAHRPPSTEAEAQALLAEYIMDKRLLDERTGRLQAWVRLHGKVAAGGMVADYGVVKSDKYPNPEMLVAVLNSAGVDPVGYFKPDAEKIRRLGIGKPEIEMALAAIRKVEQTNRWTVKRGDGEDE
jgi:CRISPR/Cas system-associated exonuclease Cas4 (RecB family)